MANRIELVNSVFKTSVSRNHIRENISEAESLKAVQVNIRTALKNVINQNVSVVGTVALKVRMEDSCIRVVFVVVSNLAGPVLLKTSFIDRSVNGILPSKRNIGAYNFKPIQIFAI